MKILLTNDDGIESPGLAAVKDALQEKHEVWVFAPEGERSGMSHSISVSEAVKVRKQGKRAYSCSGSPADCVLFSLLGALPIIPDVIVSGMNIGANLGTDIIYSGTAAAAREAALKGKPGIAISLAERTPPLDFRTGAQFLYDNLELLFSLWTAEHFININIPNGGKAPARIEITHPSTRIYKDRLVHYTAPDGDIYYFLDGSNPEADGEAGSDWHAVSAGNISITPVFLHPIHHQESYAYKHATFKVPRI